MVWSDCSVMGVFCFSRLLENQMYFKVGIKIALFDLPCQRILDPVMGHIPSPCRLLESTPQPASGICYSCPQTSTPGTVRQNLHASCLWLGLDLCIKQELTRKRREATGVWWSRKGTFSFQSDLLNKTVTYILLCGSRSSRPKM